MQNAHPEGHGAIINGSSLQMDVSMDLARAMLIEDIMKKLILSSLVVTLISTGAILFMSDVVFKEGNFQTGSILSNPEITSSEMDPERPSLLNML